MRFKGVLVALLSLLLAVLFPGCALNDKNSVRIGVSMPTQERQRWNQDGGHMQSQLEKQGYRVDLQFADNDPDLQIAQIEHMIKEGCRVIVITSVDAHALSEVLDKAKSAGIKIISYDRLIMDTDAVDYYATFDNMAVGAMQGEYIEEKLGLKSGLGPYHMEIAAGCLDDNNALALFEGSMCILWPYIQSGQLVVKSGQVSLKQCATERWREDIARERMEGILQTYYKDDRLDVVLCANDSTSLGVQTALKEAGYPVPGQEMPITTGQDADIKNVKAILRGDQTMTIFKDTRILAGVAVKMVSAIISGKEPETNDIGNYSNGVQIVPSFLVRPQFVDISNYKEVLVDSGYYKMKDLQE